MQVTALWPRVASPKAQQVAWAAPVSKDPDWQAPVQRVQRIPGASVPSQRTRRAPAQHHDAGNQPLRHQVPAVAREPPGALIFVHLKQPLTDTRVHAPGDERLYPHEFSRQGMFVVSITIVRSDAVSVPEGWRRQVLHGVLGSREHVAPEELPLSQGFIELTQQALVGRVETRRARAASVRASCLAMMGWLGVPEARLKWSITVETRGGT